MVAMTIAIAAAAIEIMRITVAVGDGDADGAVGAAVMCSFPITYVPVFWRRCGTEGIFISVRASPG